MTVEKNPPSRPAFRRLAIFSSTAPWGALLLLGVALGSPLLWLDILFQNGYHDTQRWLQLITLIVVGILTLWRIAFGVQPPPSFWVSGNRLLVSICLLGLVSAYRSARPEVAAFEVGLFFFLILAMWVIASEASSSFSKTLQAVLIWTVLGSLLYQFKAIITYGAALFSGVISGPGYLIPGFDTYRFFNHGQTITLPLLGLAACLAGDETRLRRAVSWLALVGWWALLFVSAGRGTLVGVVAAAAIVGVAFGLRAWPWIRTMALGALGGLVVYVVMYVFIPLLYGLPSLGFLEGVVERSVNNMGSRRGPLWSCAYDMLVAHPWFGGGPMHYAQICAPLNIAAHPHNWVLQIAAEWGLLALACACAAVVLGLRSLLQCMPALESRDKRNQAILTCWLATAIAIMVDGMVSGLLVMPVSQLWLVVYLGLSVGWLRSFHAGPALKQSSNSRPRQFAAIVAILGGAWLLVIGIGATQTAAKTAELNAERLAPRAWGYGFF